MKKENTILSGIQPSGYLHWGNYFGAIRQHIELQDKGNTFYFIANYHALTALKDKEALQKYTFSVALDYLSLGLDPQKSTLFLQSSIPQVTELAWILSTVCPVSRMEKSVAYKDKIAQGIFPNLGLFTYPVLQAADILIYGSDIVPVGNDQKQNIEITRDLAAKFNNEYHGNYLTIPKASIMENVAIVPGIDGKKMSKSYNNHIGLFEEERILKKKIFSIVTSGIPLEQPKDPKTCNVYTLITLFASKEKRESIANAYQKGNYGYGEAKKELFEMVKTYFSKAKENRNKWLSQPQKIMDILEHGAKKATQRAESIMQPIREVTGLTIKPM